MTVFSGIGQTLEVAKVFVGAIKVQLKQLSVASSRIGAIKVQLLVQVELIVFYFEVLLKKLSLKREVARAKFDSILIGAIKVQLLASSRIDQIHTGG